MCLKKIMSFILLFLHVSLFAMDIQPIVLEIEKQLVFETMVPYLADHESICSVASTSKKNNKAIRNLTERRKELFYPEVAACSEIVWRPYATACVGVYQDKDGNLILMHSYLENSSVQMNKIILKEMNYLPSTLFFDEENNLSCYGYGYAVVAKENAGWKAWVQGINQYDITGKVSRCILSTKKTHELVTRLDMFLNYPFLLYAILKSKNCKNGKQREFFLENVIVPADYQVKKEAPFKIEMAYQDFESLPCYIRKPIEEQYEYQYKQISNNQKI